MLKFLFDLRPVSGHQETITTLSVDDQGRLSVTGNLTPTISQSAADTDQCTRP